MKNWRWMAVLCVAWFLVTGCQTTSNQWTPTGNPQADAKLAVEKGPAKDRVLWEYRLAANDMRSGNFPEARQTLDDVLLHLGGLTAGDKSARQARGYFHAEDKKMFRGEPYERVMAYYYRGILYWMDGEPDNARACFRNAQIQDSDTEQKEYASDYVLLDYLEGLATAKLAGDGSDAFKRAEKNTKGVPLPPKDAKANVLVFIEAGRGPTKYASGEYGEELRFMPGRSDAAQFRIRIGDVVQEARAIDDLSYQATTRGGRVMDHILGNKAVFKSATDTVGNVAIVGGAVLATQRETTEAGLGLLAFGLASKIISAVTTPAADTRCWDNLPQYLSFSALRVPPGPSQAIIEFFDAGGRPLYGLTKTIQFTVPTGPKDLVLFVSDQSKTPQVYESK